MTDYTSARVLADSVSSVSSEAHRLTTLEVTFPRIILAEFNTHRVFSRNSASSRAIPVKRQIENVLERPYVPQRFPLNQAGMSAAEYIMPGDSAYIACVWKWLAARDAAVEYVKALVSEGVHKQIVNRLLEPWMWHTVIVSSTEWDNFFELRISEFAQPEIRRAAELMREAMDESTPNFLGPYEWHLPLVTSDDVALPLAEQIKCSVARCAAVSYNRHTDRDVDKELSRYKSLAQNRHLSPFEHAATPSVLAHANFRGWEQARFYLERGLPLEEMVRD